MCARVRAGPVAILPLLVLALAAATAVGLGGCGRGSSVQETAPSPLSRAEREVYARKSLVDARLLRREGRLEAAERSTRRGLRYEPDNPKLHRLRAELLETLGRPREASLHRERADALDPPPPPLPEDPLALGGRGLLVLLVPPSPELPRSSADASRVPSDWPRGEVAATLVSRLRTRLPEASVSLLSAGEYPGSQSTTAARRWLEQTAPRAALSLRVERAFCGDSAKDGAFAVAWLRLATAGLRPPEHEIAEVQIVRHVVEEPAHEGCRSEAVARALERSFDQPQLQLLLGLPAERRVRSWSSREIHNLFPELNRRLQEYLDHGRRLLSVGQLGPATEAFRRAAAVDPENPDARALLLDAQRSLSISQQLSELDSSDGPDSDPDFLEPRLTPAQRSALEAQLAFEKRRREQLLAALAVLGERRRPPSAETLAALRSSQVEDPEATGPRLARARIDDPEKTVTTRIAMAPDGEILTRYYFAEGTDEPLVREDDADGDGRPDRWVFYDENTAREVWETAGGGGPPVLHLVYAPDGTSLELIEMDADRDGHPERVFRYNAGHLELEERDSNGDGRVDLLQYFDPAGALRLREQDLDGDGVPDVRTTYRNGHLIRREIANPELLESPPRGSGEDP
jgi:tetratricopeptide (TPR) repeat protein